ncbi:Panacea domain-containing protein [Candidatus Phytoplasma australiense]|nr:type II toxin-antitoxin system antitoxin SocA domain-containing protein [Candidatus Phytoplasma australiense]
MKLKRCKNIYIFALANYLIQNMEVNHWKLQKLLYYAHAKHLVDFKESLAAAQVEAWEKGPIFRTLFDKLKDHDSKEIITNPIPCSMRGQQLNASRLQVLNFVMEKYGWVDSKELMRQAINKLPCQQYYESPLPGYFPKVCVIPDIAIYQYFKKPENWHEFS